MYKQRRTGTFKKDVKLCIKRNYDVNILIKAIKILAEKGELPDDYLPHLLQGNLKGYWECHLKPDWLLIWYIEYEKTPYYEFDEESGENKLIEGTVVFVNTGTHSDLFK